MLLDPKQAAIRLKVTRAWVSKAFKDGLFPNAFQIGGRYGPIRIPEQDLEALKRQPWKESTVTTTVKQ